jgi:hypothetical protein
VLRPPRRIPERAAPHIVQTESAELQHRRIRLQHPAVEIHQRLKLHRALEDRAETLLTLGEHCIGAFALRHIADESQHAFGLPPCGPLHDAPLVDDPVPLTIRRAHTVLQ